MPGISQRDSQPGKCIRRFARGYYLQGKDINLVITKADYSGEVPVLSFTICESGTETQNWIPEVITHGASEISFL